MANSIVAVQHIHICKMSAFDEQNDEIEVLSSIFPSEMQIISSKPHKFRIHISPNPGGEDNHGK